MSEQKGNETFWKRRWKVVLNVVTVCALIALVYAIRHDIVQTFKNLADIKAWVLLLMIPIQFLNYDAQARIYKSLFKLEGTQVDYWQIMRATLELNFVNHVFPSGGVTGISYFSLRLKNFGVNIAKATAAHMLKLILVFLSFELLIVIAVVALAIGGHINNVVLLLAGSLVTSVIFITGAMAFIIGSKQRISGFFAYIMMWVNKFVRMFRRDKSDVVNVDKVRGLFEEMHEYYVQFSRDWRRLNGALFWAFMANMWEVMTIVIVYVAFGNMVNIGAIILAYAVANFAGFVSILPGGVGVYEALMTLMLSATGVPSRLSIPVTITYRIVNTLIQVPAGYIAYQLYIHRLKPTEKEKFEDLVEGDDESRI